MQEVQYFNNKLQILKVSTVIIAILAFIIFEFLRYASGDIYLMSIILSILYSLFYIIISHTFSYYVEVFVKKVTIVKVDSRRYVFYFFFFMILC